MTYAAELAKDSRTPQTIVELHMSRCDNHYTVNSKPNLLLRSEEFGNAAWVNIGTPVITSNATTDPLGTSTADKVDDNDAGVDEYIRQDSGVAAAGKTVNFSVWVKRDTVGSVQLQVSDAGAEFAAGTFIVGTSWIRLDVTKTFTGGAAGNIFCRLKPTDGVAASTGYAYFWGAQLTQSAFPLVYAKTVAATAQTSICQATDQGDGARCGYSYFQCQDQANYKSTGSGPNPGIRIYKFCYQDAPLAVGGIGLLPYLVNYTPAEQRIDPAKALTYRERAVLTFLDEPIGQNFDADKLPGLTNTTTAGTFWRRWREVHRNYAERRVVIKEGFVGDAETEYQTVFDGLFSDFDLNADGTVTIQAVNKLKRAARKIPKKISDTNVLTTGYTPGGPTLDVTDATEFTDPARLSVNAECIIEVGADTRQELSGVVIFTTGSTVVTGSGTKFLTENPFAGSVAFCQLWADSDDEVHAQLVTSVASDVALTLARPYTGRGGQARGVIKRSSFMRVTAVNVLTNQLSVTDGVWEPGSNSYTPGAKVREVIWIGTDLGTSVTTEDALDEYIRLLRRGGIPEADIDVTGIQSERDLWHSGTSAVKCLRLIRDEVSLEEELQNLSIEGGFDIIVSPAGVIGAKVFRPPLPSETNPILDDASSFVAGSMAVEDDDEDGRLTSVTIAFDQKGGRDGDKPEHYHQRITQLNAAAESAAGFGDVKEFTILSKNLFRSEYLAARTVVGRRLARFLFGVKTVPFSLELKDAGYDVGDLAQLNTGRIQSIIGGNNVETYQIVSKKRAGLNRYDFRAIRAFGKRYAIIGPNSMASDYDARAAADIPYAYIGDSSNKVGNSKADGFYIF